LIDKVNMYTQRQTSQPDTGKTHRLWKELFRGRDFRLLRVIRNLARVADICRVIARFAHRDVRPSADHLSPMADGWHKRGVHIEGCGRIAR
jgi:hypothetical protein